jgi:hypothetical protein
MARIAFSMPRDVANQPLLVLSFVPEPSSWVIGILLGLMACCTLTWLHRAERHAESGRNYS